jgi:ATP dependent DNA ligase C terminal region
VGTGMPVKILADRRRRSDPIARKTSPLSASPPRSTRFSSPLILSRVHWVEPKLVAEITYLTWTADALLRHTVYVGLREDKPGDGGSAGGHANSIGCNPVFYITRLGQQRQAGVDVKGTQRLRPWTAQLGGLGAYGPRQGRTGTPPFADIAIST